MACTTDLYDKALNKLLKMSLVPVPCQEYKLSKNGCVRSESLEWVLDLKDKKPIWSRLNDINTAGFNRKLPMSMCKNYDIEINDRLWSLWGHTKQKPIRPDKNATVDMSYLATTVMGLCAARVFRLNLWNSQLIDNIAINGRTFFKNSFKQFCGKKCKFQLEDLSDKCSLEGVNFEICMNTVVQGRLYCTPFHGRTNLAFALINFLANCQYGLLECFNRVLGFGFLPGPEGGYFMFDAQTMGKPLFPQNTTAPYLLRTNHLQILLYCLVVALNVPHMQANFCIHHLKIDVIKPAMPKIRYDPKCKCKIKPTKCILPKECWKVPSIPIVRVTSTNVFDELAKTRQLVKKEKPQPCVSIYRRKSYNLTKEKVQKSIIKPMIDADRGSKENLKECNDFLKIICSETKVPLTETEEANLTGTSFVIELNEAFVMGRP